ncbi:MAG: hypothetical protein EP329_20385 [Deltaproteobacteria bacterium]|nr:MAG: hypothetical protein EP329_20385 [Deltaproteobacteria bacterium]
MKPWIPPLLVSLALGAGCIEASRPAGDDTLDSDTSGSDAVDPADTTGSDEVAPTCGETQCTIDGACVDPGVIRQGQPCFVCDAAKDPTGWSQLEQGAACDDGDSCSPISTCTAEGTCVGEADPVCLDPPSCVLSTSCTGGACTYDLLQDTCLVDGVCHATGDTPEAGSCAICAPAQDRFAWTHRTTGACDDGDDCTLDDACGEGGLCAGVEMACDDQVACTTDYCDGGVCHFDVEEEACYIGGTCYDDGDRSLGAGGVQCGVCENASDPSDWTPATGGSCDDGDLCTTADTCAGGTCAGVTLVVGQEPNDTPNDFIGLGAGNIEPEAGFPSGTVHGNLNPVGDMDFFGYGMLMNLNAVKRKPKVLLSGLDENAAYELCIWARCGVSDVSAALPTVSCPVGNPVTLEGSFVGCCRTIAGTTDFGVSLQASCTESQSSTDIGLVRVRVQFGSDSLVACPSYTMEWGAVNY